MIPHIRKRDETRDIYQRENPLGRQRTVEALIMTTTFGRSMLHVGAKDFFNFHDTTEAPQPVVIAD